METTLEGINIGVDRNKGLIVVTFVTEEKESRLVLNRVSAQALVDSLRSKIALLTN